MPGKWVAVPTDKKLNELLHGIMVGIKEAKKIAPKSSDNLKHWLEGSGETIIENLNWLKTNPSFVEGENENRERFMDDLNKLANQMKNSETRTLKTYWDVTIKADLSKGEKDLKYGWGTSSIRSVGTFTLTKNNDLVSITGKIENLWWDEYNWEPGWSTPIPGVGKVEDKDLKLLEVYRGAKAFSGRSAWAVEVNGAIKIGMIWNSKNITFSLGTKVNSVTFKPHGKL
jgi:hypothetical protein